MDAMVYFEAADCLLNDYKEMDPYDEIFLEDGEEADTRVRENANIEGKSMNLLQKGAAAIRKLFAKIKGIIDSILDYFKTDKETKSQYQKFVQAVKDNPEFAGKKVTIKDYKEIAEAWKKEMNAEEKAYRNLKDEELANKPSLAADFQEACDKGREKIKELGKAGAKEVTVQWLLEYAKSCQAGAIEARGILNTYEGYLSSLEAQLGKKEARKVKRQLKMLSSRFKCLRKLAGGKEIEYLTWKDGLKNVFSAEGMGNIVLRTKGVGGVASTVGKVAMNEAHVAKEATKQAAQSTKKLKKRAKNMDEKTNRDIVDMAKAREAVDKKEMTADQFKQYQKRKNQTRSRY